MTIEYALSMQDLYDLENPADFISSYCMLGSKLPFLLILEQLFKSAKLSFM